MRAIVLFFLISGMLTACSGDDKTVSRGEAETTKEHSDAVPKGEVKPNQSGGVSQEKLEIVTSIKPIQAIVLAIVGDTANVQQLIPDYANPHDYSFKPSDIRKVKNADVVFRIDEHMETQLNGVFENLDSDAVSIVSLSEGNGIKLLDAGDSHDREEHELERDSEHSHEHDKHEHNEKHNDNESHDHHDNIDFHIWTSPKNAVLMANQITKILSSLDTKNSAKYQQNIEDFFEKVKAESEKIAVKLSPFKQKPYIVFHNSWQYFADEFGLQKPIVVDLHEGISSGAKTVIQIRERIAKENIQCVFYDSSVSEARLKTITAKANTSAIDVLAKGIELNQESYIKWLQQLGNQIESCLSR